LAWRRESARGTLQLHQVLDPRPETARGGVLGGEVAPRPGPAGQTVGVRGGLDHGAREGGRIPEGRGATGVHALEEAGEGLVGEPDDRHAGGPGLQVRARRIALHVRADEQVHLAAQVGDQLAREVHRAREAHATFEGRAGQLGRDGLAQLAVAEDLQVEVAASSLQLPRDGGQVLHALHCDQAPREGQAQGQAIAPARVAGGEIGFAGQQAIVDARIEEQQRMGIERAVGVVGRRAVALQAGELGDQLAHSLLQAAFPELASPALQGIGDFGARDLAAGLERVLRGRHEGHAALQGELGEGQLFDHRAAEDQVGLLERPVRAVRVVGGDGRAPRQLAGAVGGVVQVVRRRLDRPEERVDRPGPRVREGLPTRPELGGQDQVIALLHGGQGGQEQESRHRIGGARGGDVHGARLVRRGARESRLSASSFRLEGAVRGGGWVVDRGPGRPRGAARVRGRHASELRLSPVVPPDARGHVVREVSLATPGARLATRRCRRRFQRSPRSSATRRAPRSDRS
jgi:hypothetical protein